MRLAGGFQKLDGRTTLALFAAPVLAAGWALAAGPKHAPESQAAANPCAPANSGATTQSLQYRDGEVKLGPGPRALTAEWIWLKVREARMIAERSDRDTLMLPPHLASVERDPAWTQALASERAILQARRATHYGFERELGKRLAQIRREHAALLELAQGRKREQDLLSRELNGIAYLHKKGLATTGRLVSLQRDMERMKADQAQLEIDAERVRSRAGEVELELLRRNSDRQIEIADGLRMIETRFAEIEDMRAGSGAPLGVANPAPKGNEDAQLILAAASGSRCGHGE